jgi:hypothetical protein
VFAYLVEIDAWTGAGVETLRLATTTIVTRPTDVPANTPYQGAITDVGSLVRQIFAGGATTGQPSVSYGYVEIANLDGRFDAWLDYGFDGRAFRLKALRSKGAPVAGAETIFVGTLAGIDGSDAMRALRLRVRDRLAELNRPLLTARYAGTTISGSLSTAEGDADLKDKVKPRVFGRVLNAPAVAANRFRLLYQWSAGPVAALAVYDGGLALTPTVDYPTLSSLLAGTLTGGQYATCLAQGIARLGGAPEFTVTADVTEGVALADRSAARVVGRILDAMGVADRDEASFAALHAAAPAEVGVHVTEEDKGLDVVARVLDSVGAALVPSTTGAMRLVRLQVPSGAPVKTIRARDIVGGSEAIALAVGAKGEGEGVPAYRVILTHGRVWQTLSGTELAGAVAAERRAYLETAEREAKAESAAVLAVHPLAPEIKIETLLLDAADAAAEATRRLAIYGARRDRASIPLVFDEGSAVDLGDVVAIDHPRFGWAGGKLLQVLGRTDDWQRRMITLDVFG